MVDVSANMRLFAALAILANGLDRQVRRLFILAGDSLIVIALFGFVSLVQGGDLDCEYTTEVFLQLRMCAGEPQALPLTQLAIIVGVFLLGVLCDWFGAKNRPEIECKSEKY